MLSRVANSIYWMSRYIERAENVGRFMEVNLQLILDLPLESNKETQWKPLVSITGDEEYFLKKYGEPSRENVTYFHTLDPNYPHSIYSCVRKARENARSIREIISSEMWEQINKFYHLISSPDIEQRSLRNPFVFFEEIRMACHLFSGITDGTMQHGESWRYLRLGRLLERADKTSRILDVKYFLLLPKVEHVGSPVDNLQWAALLKSTSSLEAYRKNYRAISPDKVARFLILDREFPRSIHYCLIKAEQSLNAITGSPPGTFKNSAERKLGKLKAKLNYTTTEEIINIGLHEFLDNVQLELNSIGKAIHEIFFAVKSVHGMKSG